ncbi:MAG: hypothetical protein LBF51_09115 [Zoogloeaceae bacterium]|jgi:RAQPRD family integrative conjugative element protein|nr:hypothetical protein [Zoogloeaceae bacterium]
MGSALPLAALLLCVPPAFADDAIQRQEPAAVLRQLDLAERLARHGELTRSMPPEARYHFWSVIAPKWQ